VSLFDDAENISCEKASRKEKVKKTLPKSLFENYRRKLGMTNIRDLRLRENIENDNLKEKNNNIYRTPIKSQNMSWEKENVLVFA
jgi:hypothetical protein